MSKLVTASLPKWMGEVTHDQCSLIILSNFISRQSIFPLVFMFHSLLGKYLLHLLHFAVFFFPPPVLIYVFSKLNSLALHFQTFFNLNRGSRYCLWLRWWYNDIIYSTLALFQWVATLIKADTGDSSGVSCGWEVVTHHNQFYVLHTNIEKNYPRSKVFIIHKSADVAYSSAALSRSCTLLA